MKHLIELGNRYASESDWTDFALTKLCLCAIGVLIGINISEKDKKYAVPIAGGIFLATYIPLMTKVFKIIKEMRE